MAFPGNPVEKSVSVPVNIEIPIQELSADSSTFMLPFSRAGNLILIKARADLMEGNFVLDTGCPGLVLNLTYFRNSTRIDTDEEGNGITAANFSISKTLVNSFSFGAARHYRVEADLANLGNIENSKGVKILGLIGVQFLADYEMIIDYEKNYIYLHRMTRKEASSYRHQLLNDTSAYSTVPITITDNRILVESTLAGKKVKLIIDSGAETNLLDSRLPDKVFELVSITGKTIMTGVGTTKTEVLRGELSTLMIGNQPVKNLPVLITNLEKTCFSLGGCVSGVLGFDFLSLKQIGFNFVTKKMYIWK